MLQSFEWHTPDDQQHYQRLTSSLENYRAVGIDSIWLPPACKAANPHGNGYDIYDLYDLGEFDQKGSVATKWGNKADLTNLCEKSKQLGIGLYFDAVINHKAGADRIESCPAVGVEDDDRTKETGERKEIEAWLGFDFQGRGDRYSSQKYHWQHFSGTDYNATENEKAIYKILGPNKDWAQDVDKDKGNYDYLMFANLDYSNREVREDVINWGEWITDELPLSGFRVDAVKHISRGFMNEWFGRLNRSCRSDRLFFLCEYWTYSVPTLCEFLDQITHKVSLYDPCLLQNFLSLSRNERADLRTVFRNTLVQARPNSTVTLVQNHDTQPGQVVDSPIADWFLPIAYALILLRRDGYPCVFYGDLHGIGGPKPHGPTCDGKLPDLILVRKLYAYGAQNEYFDKPQCVGWTREGTWDRPDGVAVLMSSAGPAQKKMRVGRRHEGELWTDVLGNADQEVRIDRKGVGVFACPGNGVSVFVKGDAVGREHFGKFY